MSPICSHTDSITVTELPAEIAGCQDCLAIGGRWVHLRMCQSCGRIGCCDSSPHRHASAHARTSRHPIARSAEPGEDWSWCYIDNAAFVVQAMTQMTLPELHLADRRASTSPSACCRKTSSQAGRQRRPEPMSRPKFPPSRAD